MQNPDSGNSSTKGGRTITVNVPDSTVPTLGLAPVISWLLLAALWAVVGIGYICVPGSIVGGVIGVAVAVMNLGGGVAPALLALGCGIACFGLCLPVFHGTRFLHALVLRQSKEMSAGLRG